MSKSLQLNPDVQRLVGRTMIDATFRQQLLANPAEVAQAAGFNLSDSDLAHLAQLKDQKIQELLVIGDDGKVQSYWA